MLLWIFSVPRILKKIFWTETSGKKSLHKNINVVKFWKDIFNVENRKENSSITDKKKWRFFIKILNLWTDSNDKSDKTHINKKIDNGEHRKLWKNLINRQKSNYTKRTFSLWLWIFDQDCLISKFCESETTTKRKKKIFFLSISWSTKSF